MKSTFYKYLILTILFFLLTEITKHILNFDKLVYNSLAEKLTSNQIKNLFDFQDKWKWLGYVFIPIYILLKTSIIATVLYIGVFFFSKKEVKFKLVWEIVVKSEFVFLLVPVFKILWFCFVETNYKLNDFQYFYPLSALNIIGYTGLETWFIYPFQTLNLFELVYWLLLAFYLGKATETNMDKGFKIVVFSYGPALLLWIVLVMFLTLNNS
ncbi:hypothetical protein [Flavobacterium sp.]|uniref:hypothetical protein n=1 Tax=Flavobacterium sp. TaxID=239 RepID=UPI00286E5590|nr:hypothetical protein [Flavobacterium sp.]